MESNHRRPPYQDGALTAELRVTFISVWWIRKDSNLRNRFFRPVLCLLSYRSLAVRVGLEPTLVRLTTGCLTSLATAQWSYLDPFVSFSPF